MQRLNSPAPDIHNTSGAELALGLTISKTPSMPGVSQSDKMDSVQSAMTDAPDRAGRISPSSPTSSRTPLPSTRAPPMKPSPARSQNERTQQIRTPSPSAPLLSSPPPTVQMSSVREADRPAESSYTSPTAEQISNASSAELRSFIEKAVLEIVDLNQSLHESRTAAAHYRLQNNLLSYEAGEAAKRMAVEYEMMRREIDVLQRIAVKRRETTSQQDEPSPPSHLTLELKRQCQSLQAENDLLRRRLGRAKKVIRIRDGEITSLLAESERLRTRIKENREHFDRLRRRGVSYSGSTPRQLEFQTPMAQRTASRHGDSAKSPYSAGPGNGGEDTFAALLLADQVLSQEDASARSTPAHPRPSRPAHLGHSRGTQSLSSLPSTPGQFPLVTSKITDTTSTARVRDLSEPQTARVKTPSPRHRRGESTDTTISASEDEATKSNDRRRSNAKKDSSDVIQESEASQLATHMLRRPAVISRDSTGSAAAKASSPTQTKLPSGRGKRGSLTKRTSDEVGTASRKSEAGEHEDDVTRASKRAKTGKGGAVGLGIGGLGR